MARLHLPVLEAGLRAENRLAGAIVLPPGEATKSFRELGPLCERLLRMGLERGDLVVAFGGGVIGDIAGFAASILRRGVGLVQVPTTLLAQVDSSVGGKTGINTPQGKNLIGTFHQPALVVADTDVLATLPLRELRAGYAEVANTGSSAMRASSAGLERSWGAVLGGDADALASRHRDERQGQGCDRRARRDRDGRPRAAQPRPHLRPRAGSRDRLLGPAAWHGEGVAIGMCLAFRLSEELGLCASGTAGRVTRHLDEVGLPTHRPDRRRVPGPGRSPRADAPGQEGASRAADPRAGARHRRGVPHAGYRPERLEAFLAAEMGRAA